MKKKIILNADDFGWTDGHNMAVEKAYHQGVLHRASLMCTGEAFFEAVEISHSLPKLQVGVHLTLNEGFALIGHNHLPNLTGENGKFYDDVLDLARLWLQNKLDTYEAVFEWDAQITRIIGAGINPTHLDSHKHVHLIPPLLEAIIWLAQKHQIKYIRLPLEKSFHNILRRGLPGFMLWMLALRAKRGLSQTGLNFADHFIGIGYSGEMTASHLQQVLSKAREGLTEIMVHPAVVTSAVLSLGKRYEWAARYKFEDELKALCLLRADVLNADLFSYNTADVN